MGPKGSTDPRLRNPVIDESYCGHRFVKRILSLRSQWVDRRFLCFEFELEPSMAANKKFSLLCCNVRIIFISVQHSITKTAVQCFFEACSFIRLVMQWRPEPPRPRLNWFKFQARKTRNQDLIKKLVQTQNLK